VILGPTISKILSFIWTDRRTWLYRIGCWCW